MQQRAIDGPEPDPGLCQDDDRGQPDSGAPLRVCVDGRTQGTAGTGVKHYAETLLHSLKLAGIDPLLLMQDEAPRSRKPTDGRWRRWSRAATTFKPQAARTQQDRGRTFFAPDLFRQAHVHFRMFGRLTTVRLPGPPGVMHWTYPVPLRVEGWRNLYTVHDVIPLQDSSLTPIDPRHHRNLLHAVAGAADRLVTVSESARADIIHFLGCRKEMVVNTSQAVLVRDLQGGVEGFDQREYFLFCGSIEPRKNLERLVAAYRASGSRRSLVIVGPEGWQADWIRASLVGTGVTVLPYQPRDVLMRLIRDARAVVFPSLSEGFGLPVMEAMSLGTPVMASDRGALAEICGDDALLVDPYDVEQMARTIARLDHDDPLCDRLGLAGLARSLAFQPATYATRLLELYGARATAPAWA